MPQPDRVTFSSLRPVMLADLAFAVFELALARFRLGNWAIADVLERAPDIFQAVDTPEPDDDDRDLIRRIQFALPRAAARVPWRSDCLVQALAARRWLERHAIASSLSIGVANEPGIGFEAHAWTCAGETVVAGGDVSRYQVLRVPIAPSGR